MQFTGERFMPTEQGRIRLEHYHRYAVALDLVQGKKVLDVACGEGYGSSLLATVAQSVTGVDISDEAVGHASNKYKNENLKFQQGSATALNFADATFEVVVSFETVEHLLEQEQMIAEIRRVLKPDGILIISSPNRPIYTEESGEVNHFHVKELDFNEFDLLLKTKFQVVHYLGQRIIMGSVIQSLEESQSYYQAWHDDGKEIKTKSARLTDPVYFLAVCSAVESSAKINTSILCPDQLDLVKHYVGFAKWAQAQDEVIEHSNEQIRNQQQQLSEKDAQLDKLNQDLLAQLESQSEKDAQLDKLNQDLLAQLACHSEKDAQLDKFGQEVVQLKSYSESAQIEKLNEAAAQLESHTEKDAQLNMLSQELAQLLSERQAIMNSTSWRITLPLREIKKLLGNPKSRIKIYIRVGLQMAKRVFNLFPIDVKTKHKILEFLAKKLPRVVRAAGLDPEIILYGASVNPAFKEVIAYEPVAIPVAIKIPQHGQPKVSVVIPIYGKVDYTLACLASIAQSVPETSFEVIVVDDKSPDNSVEVLKKIDGIRLIVNEKNQGFIRSCNVGAAAASGEFVYFLNNDTNVLPGWLDELYRTFEAFPSAGFVGSKLVYPDGTLQEAGGIIWRDGSAWNFGRNQNPRLPEFNYAREVDYCSGASIMVPTRLFRELGGFDEHYLPAYCEDSDLALKIRDKGYSVIYQPLSEVIHFEGITSGTDLNQGAKAYQVENSKKLLERWKNRLMTHQENGVDVDTAKDRMLQRRVLLIEHCTPTPDKDAGSVSVFNIILLLRDMGYQVTFIPEDNFLYMPDYTTKLQRLGVEVLYDPFCRSVEQHVELFGNRYDLVFLFRPKVVEKHIGTIRRYCPQAKVLFYTHDIHHIRMQREAVLFDDAEKHIAADEMKAMEFAAIKSVDSTIVVSTSEYEQLKQDLPNQKMHILPLILAIPGTEAKFEQRAGIVFVGGYQHTPNIDAAKYFVDEVMPELRKKLAGVTFYIVGSNAPDEIRALAAEDVEVVGFIDDLTSFLNKMRLAVAPLRYGAGIKGKIGTAMAAGLPTVATTIAAEGMSLTHGENILVTDGATEFADEIARLYDNETLWNHLSSKGINYAHKTWGLEAAHKTLAMILDDIDLPQLAKNGQKYE